MAGVRISALPAMVHMDPSNLLPMVDELATPSIQTQKITLAQLMTFLQQNLAFPYSCTSDPNAETVSAFFGSIAVATSTGGVWQKQSAGFSNSGWVQIIA